MHNLEKNNLALVGWSELAIRATILRTGSLLVRNEVHGRNSCELIAVLNIDFSCQAFSRFGETNSGDGHSKKIELGVIPGSIFE
jgi:hypothetical protein